MTDDADTRVLVVDDEPRFVEAHARMLREEYVVETARSGEQALEIVDETFDVVLLDRQMPGLDGDEVAARLREDGLDCRIVLLTAVEPDVDIIEMGIDDYLTKPASETDLKECIEELLEWTDYDNPMQDFFALSNKRDVLLEERSTALEPDRLTEIERRIEQKAQEGLQKNREVLETLIQSSPAAIVTLDMAGKVDIWNPSAEEMFGWAAEEVDGERPPIFAENARKEMKQIRTNLFTDSIVTDLDIECVTKTGAPLSVSLSAAPLYDSDGSMNGTMFVMMDITERKQREQRLNVLGRVLRHNIRNDLTVIIGRAQALEGEVSGENAEHMRKMIDIGQQLLQMSEKARDVQEILDTDTNDVDERDVAAVVRNNLDQARQEYPDAELSLAVETGKTTVLASEGLAVATWNLIENAIEHNTSDQPRVEITITAESGVSTHETRVDIADNGPGIPSDELEPIQDGVEDALKHGSSLGLWVVKWIVDRSGGELGFGGNEMDGTTATVTLRRIDDTENSG